MNFARGWLASFKKRDLPQASHDPCPPGRSFDMTPVGIPRDHEEVQLLIVGQRMWQPPLASPEEARDARSLTTLVRGSCTVVPGNTTQAYTARHLLMGVKGVKLSDNAPGESAEMAYSPLWAVAIDEASFRAVPKAVWRDPSTPHDTLRQTLLRYGGRQARRFKTTIPAGGDGVGRRGRGPPCSRAWVGGDEARRADTELCLLEFDFGLIGPAALAAAGDPVDPKMLKGWGHVEVMQLGFPVSICTSAEVGALAKPPSWAQDVKFWTRTSLAYLGEKLAPLQKVVAWVVEKLNPGSAGPQRQQQKQLPPDQQLQWVPNTDIAQGETRFLCARSSLRAGQESLTILLPSSSTRGDPGGGAYLVVRDPKDPEKMQQWLLGIIVGGQHCEFLSWAWPVNKKLQGLLKDADWKEF